MNRLRKRYKNILSNNVRKLKRVVALPTEIWNRKLGETDSATKVHYN